MCTKHPDIVVHCKVESGFILGVDGLQCRAHQKLLPLQTLDLQQVEPAKLLSDPKILNPEFLDFSKSIFISVTQLNVISDRRQFTLKLIREREQLLFYSLA